MKLVKFLLLPRKSLKINNYELRITNYELRITNYLVRWLPDVLEVIDLSVEQN
jgi:hypothetical protein